MKEKCKERTNDRRIVFSEKRSKITFINSDQVEAIKITVDGCEIKEGIKCDYLLLAKDVEHYIELKGQNINHAVEQIERTISLLSKNKQTQTKTSYIICTRSPLTSASIQDIQVKFMRNFKSHLIVKSSPYEHRI